MNTGLLNTLMVTQIVIAIILVVAILLQPGDDGMGGLMGGSGGESFRTKRGLEKFLYYGTIFLAVAFAVLSFVIVKFSS